MAPYPVDVPPAMAQTTFAAPETSVAHACGGFHPTQNALASGASPFPHIASCFAALDPLTHPRSTLQLSTPGTRSSPSPFVASVASTTLPPPSGQSLLERENWTRPLFDPRQETKYRTSDNDSFGLVDSVAPSTLNPLSVGAIRGDCLREAILEQQLRLEEFKIRRQALEAYLNEK